MLNTQQKSTVCWKCGSSFFMVHLQTCPAKKHNNTKHNRPEESDIKDAPESDQTEESVDTEATQYIKELHQDWANINRIRPTEFIAKENDSINKELNGGFWVETKTCSPKLQWLADSGCPRSLINQRLAQQLQKEIPNSQISGYTENTKYNFFNNNTRDKRSNNPRHKVRILYSKTCKVLIVTN